MQINRLLQPHKIHLVLTTATTTLWWVMWCIIHQLTSTANCCTKSWVQLSSITGVRKYTEPTFQSSLSSSSSHRELTTLYTMKTYSGRECKFSHKESEVSCGCWGFNRTSAFPVLADASGVSSCIERDGGELVKSIVSCSKMVASSDTQSFSFDWKEANTITGT